jgi:hypothetical protein
MTSAFALAQDAGLHHYTAPWYIAVPVLVVVIGLGIWRRRRGGGGRGPFGGSGGQ